MEYWLNGLVLSGLNVIDNSGAFDYWSNGVPYFNIFPTTPSSNTWIPIVMYFS